MEELFLFRFRSTIAFSLRLPQKKSSFGTRTTECARTSSNRSGSRSEITNIAFSTCDNTLAIAEKGRLVLYDPARGQGRFMYDDLPNGRLVFSSDGKWLAGITDAKTVVVVDVRAGKKVSEYRLASNVSSLAWSPRKSVLAIGTSSEHLSLWNPFSMDDPTTFFVPGTTERWMPWSTFVWMVLVWCLCACGVYWTRRRWDVLVRRVWIAGTAGGSIPTRE